VLHLRRQNTGGQATQQEPQFGEPYTARKVSVYIERFYAILMLLLFVLSGVPSLELLILKGKGLKTECKYYTEMHSYRSI
jgi:hypothetical protein